MWTVATSPSALRILTSRFARSTSSTVAVVLISRCRDPPVAVDVDSVAIVDGGGIFVLAQPPRASAQAIPNPIPVRPRKVLSPSPGGPGRPRSGAACIRQVAPRKTPMQLFATQARCAARSGLPVYRVLLEVGIDGGAHRGMEAGGAEALEQ